MILDKVYREAILPAYEILPARMASPEATVMLLAIGLQESRLTHRRQIGGPARGLWQFEKNGGVRGVLQHPSTYVHSRVVCDVFGIAEERNTLLAARVYDALETNDVLAAAFARLLLWTDPRPLPALGDGDGAWAYYIRNWRPGKPHPRTWSSLYNGAFWFAHGQ